jgi:hypothetical protein
VVTVTSNELLFFRHIDLYLKLKITYFKAVRLKIATAKLRNIIMHS